MSKTPAIKSSLAKTMMAKTRFRSDHGLVARMSFTMFLIGALYVAVVAALIAVSVLYFWDANYNNGRFLDGLRSMGRSISHSMGR